MNLKWLASNLQLPCRKILVIKDTNLPENCSGKALTGVFGCSGRPLLVFHILSTRSGNTGFIITFVALNSCSIKSQEPLIMQYLLALFTYNRCKIYKIVWSCIIIFLCIAFVNTLQPANVCIGQTSKRYKCILLQYGKNQPWHTSSQHSILDRHIYNWNIVDCDVKQQIHPTSPLF